MYRKTESNTNGAVAFNKIDDLLDGWNVFRINEKQTIPADTPGSYDPDTHVIYAFVNYLTLSSGGSSVKVALPPVYYVTTTEDDAAVHFSETAFDRTEALLGDAIGNQTDGIALKPWSTPTFKNKENKSGLNFTKTVIGNAAESDRFTFKVTLELTEIESYVKTVVFPLTKSGETGKTDLAFKRVGDTNQFTANVIMKAGQRANIANLPINTHYTITETHVNGEAITSGTTVDGYTCANPSQTGEIQTGSNNV